MPCPASSNWSDAAPWLRGPRLVDPDHAPRSPLPPPGRSAGKVAVPQSTVGDPAGVAWGQDVDRPDFLAAIASIRATPCAPMTALISTSSSQNRGGGGHRASEPDRRCERHQSSAAMCVERPAQVDRRCERDRLEHVMGPRQPAAREARQWPSAGPRHYRRASPRSRGAPRTHIVADPPPPPAPSSSGRRWKVMRKARLVDDLAPFARGRPARWER